MGVKFTGNDYKYSSMSYPLQFTGHDGLYPLLRLPVLYKGETNPYFDNVPSYAKGRISNHIRMKSTGYGHRYSIRGRGIVTFYSGFISVIGIATNLEYLPSSLSGDKRTYKMYGNPDVFCIGVIRPVHLPKITVMKSRYSFQGRRQIVADVDMKNVTILVSIEKLRKTKFLKEHYSLTARDAIIRNINTIVRDHNVTVKDVPDEYLKNFYSIPEGIRTNSIVETLNIENEIKSNVFSNLEKLVV